MHRRPLPDRHCFIRGIAAAGHLLPRRHSHGRTANGRVSFVRSGLNVSWNAKFSSLLDFAEACDVPVRWSCRTGVCHTCESGLISGNVEYQPEPLEPPAQGNLLICCSQPRVDDTKVSELSGSKEPKWTI